MLGDEFVHVYVLGERRGRNGHKFLMHMLITCSFGVVSFDMKKYLAQRTVKYSMKL